MAKVVLTIGDLKTLVETDDETFSELVAHFAVPVPGHWFAPSFKAGYWDGRVKFLSPTTKLLPTGLLTKLREYCVKNKIKCKTQDTRDPLAKVKPVLQFDKYDLSKYPYDYQGEAVEEGLAHGRGIFEIATNGGKTAVAASLILSLKKPTLFIVGGLDLLEQAREMFEKVLDVDVAVLGGGQKKFGTVTVCTAQTLSRVAKKKPSELANYEMLIFDETHHLSSDQWFKIAQNIPARYRFGMSGTPFHESNDKDYRLIGATGEVLSRIKNVELVDREVSAKPIIKFLYSKSTLEYDDFRQAVEYGVVRNRKRNNQIVKLARSRADKGDAVLILTARRRHGLTLFRLLQKKNVRVRYNHGGLSKFIRGKNLDHFKKKGGVMVATTIYDEGIDIPQVNCMIFAMAGVTKRRVLQRIGRGLRRKKKGRNVVIFYDFIDWFSSYLLKHSEERLKLYKSEQFTVKGVGDAAKAWVISDDIRIEEIIPTPKTGSKGDGQKELWPRTKSESRQELIRKHLDKLKGK